MSLACCSPLEPARALQAAFAAAIRDPSRNPAPAEVPPRRMAVYRELFYSNVESFIASAFPVLRSLLPDPQWHDLVQDFFARHHCHTPLFAEISQEFLLYLAQERGSIAGDLPFMQELAHYEWVELALRISDAEAATADTGAANLFLSPLAWPLAYRFPVHRIRPDYQPPAPPESPTYLLVYRDEADQVHFVELSAASFIVLSYLREQPHRSADELLQAVAASLGQADAASLRQAGNLLLADLRKRGVVIDKTLYNGELSCQN
jgi:hypothetical protein